MYIYRGEFTDISRFNFVLLYALPSFKFSGVAVIISRGNDRQIATLAVILATPWQI